MTCSGGDDNSGGGPGVRGALAGGAAADVAGPRAATLGAAWSPAVPLLIVRRPPLFALRAMPERPVGNG